MDKLQELLKEYQLSKWEWVRLAWPDVDISEKEELVLEATLISKKYWFIKWLVENEKIDFDNRDLKDKYMEYFERYPYYPYTDFSLTWLIMLLSIQDEPINFLISILK